MAERQVSLIQLQSDVCAMLDRAAQLVRDAAKLLAGTPAEHAQFDEYADVFRRERQKVERLELRMAVVAPMKAGKSTIINALIGTDLLPFRNAAMTALPTAIALSRLADEPRMEIPQSLYKAVRTAERVVRAYISDNGIEEATAALGEYPSLSDMLRSIGTGDLPFHTAQLVGKEEIRAALLWLNDLNRLCWLLAPNYAMTFAVASQHMPRITAPWRDTAAMRSVDRGTLMIVDTPGPNEWKADKNLARIVQQQIETCSVVLLVLDYTALTTSAAGELKDRVRAAIDVIGSSNLIVVVNRIDQRRTPADLTPEQVESFVTSHLGLRDVRGLLFETSALYAFVGARYLRERKLRPHATVKELRTEVEAVLKADQPTKWQRKIEGYTLEEADKDAELLWEQSGFDALLKSAMAGLLEHIGPLCISTAISHARAIVRTVNEAARLRESALRSNVADLDREVRKLEKQESELEEKARDLEYEMKSVKKKLQDDLANYIDKEVREDVVVTPDDLRGEERKRRRRFSLPVDVFKRARRKENVLLFGAYRRARHFISEANDHARTAMLDVFSRCSLEVLNTIEGERQNLQRIAEKKAGPIVKSARDHLQKQFDLELEIPPYTPPPLTLREFKFQARKIEHVKRGGMKTEVRYERVFSWFPFWKRRLEVQVQEPDTTTAEYQVDLQKLADAMTKTTKAALGHFHDAINGFVEEELGTSLQKYLESLRKIISSYVANLRAARTQQGLDARTRERLSMDLLALVTSCEAELQKCALYAKLAKNVRVDTA